ncbi:hypothetical protein V8G54_015177 [Vigna mungo]|uniref:Uncharacterized protein n=1 Tax=Vigna mungo TaxID=3915 RepID=A0AAQ3NJR7_VIGMU
MAEEKMKGVEKETMSPWEQHALVINLPRFDYNAPSSLLRNSHSRFLITCTLSSRGFAAGDDIFKRRKLIDDAGEECLDSKETESATADSGDGIQFIYFLSATSHSVSSISVHVYVYSDQSQTLLHKF